jgi:hypothetical protein
MASILDRYGIKEVADVTMYEINPDGTPGKPVLFLDTLKVSTIEQTAEQVDARGGKGNPKLITWDYGKEITVSIEDALFSPKSMSIMLGDGTVTPAGTDYIRKTAVVRMAEGAAGSSANVKMVNDYVVADIYDANEGSKRVKLYIGGEETAPAGEVLLTSQIQFTNGKTDTSLENSALYDENGDILDDTFTLADLKLLCSTGKSSVYSGHKFMFTYWVKATSKTITVSGDTFPGTYYIQGDTYARSDVTGKDQFFQFIIPKAKMTAEQTITLEAEGDPSVFNMNLTVLRPEDGDMMKLVQYDLVQ